MKKNEIKYLTCSERINIARQITNLVQYQVNEVVENQEITASADNVIGQILLALMLLDWDVEIMSDNINGFSMLDDGLGSSFDDNFRESFDIVIQLANLYGFVCDNGGLQSHGVVNYVNKYENLANAKGISLFSNE